MSKYRVKRHAVVQPEDAAYRLIPLTQNQNAIVDLSDFDWLMKWNWIAHRNHPKKTFYAVRKGQKGEANTVFMQSFIVGSEVDHRNRNGLDNRRGNLRACTDSQNQANRKAFGKGSKFKGVWFEKQSGKWRSQIMVNRRAIRLGRFDEEEKAARAYDAAAREHFGEFAFTNFPD
jgi:hypothetical protein